MMNDKLNTKASRMVILVAFFSIGVIALFGFLILSPLPSATYENSIKISGEIHSVIDGGGPSDIIFRLIEEDNLYYINRGRQLGLDPVQLMKYLEDKEVSIFYAKHWSLSIPGLNTRHINKILTRDSIIYNEMKEVEL